MLHWFKRDIINVATGTPTPHQGIQGGHPLIYAGCLDGNETHAHTAQWPDKYFLFFKEVLNDSFDMYLLMRWYFVAWEELRSGGIYSIFKVRPYKISF